MSRKYRVNLYDKKGIMYEELSCCVVTMKTASYDQSRCDLNI